MGLRPRTEKEPFANELATGVALDMFMLLERNEEERLLTGMDCDGDELLFLKKRFKLAIELCLEVASAAEDESIDELDAGEMEKTLS